MTRSRLHPGKWPLRCNQWVLPTPISAWSIWSLGNEILVISFWRHQIYIFWFLWWSSCCAVLKVQWKVTYDVTQCPRSLTDTAENWSPRMFWAAVAQASLRLTQECFSRSSRERPSTDSPGKQLGSERPSQNCTCWVVCVSICGSPAMPPWCVCVCVCVCARACAHTCMPVREVWWGGKGRHRFLFASSPFYKGFQRLSFRTQEQECNCKGALRYCWPWRVCGRTCTCLAVARWGVAGFGRHKAQRSGGGWWVGAWRRGAVLNADLLTPLITQNHWFWRCSVCGALPLRPEPGPRWVCNLRRKINLWLGDRLIHFR